MTNKKILIGGIILIVALLILALLSQTLLHYLNTGTLIISTNDASAVTKYQQLNRPAKSAGKGQQLKIRLNPGEYMIDSRSGDAETVAQVSVSKGHTTTISLGLQPPKIPAKVALATARDISVRPDGLKFVNIPFRQLFSFSPGNSRSLPFLGNVYPVDHMFWLGDQKGYASTDGGDWIFVDGNNTKNIFLGKLAESDSATPPSAVAVNQKGQVVFVNNQKLFVLENPSGTSRQIDNLGRDTWMPRVSNNGSILLFDTSEFVDADKKASRQHSRIYTTPNTPAQELPADLDFIADAAWSPDGTMFTYATSTSYFVYNVGTKVSTSYLNQHTTDNSSLTWADNKHILYVQDGTVWEYDIESRTSNKLARLAGSITFPRPFSFSPDKKEVYYGTAPGPTTDSGYIYKFSL